MNYPTYYKRYENRCRSIKCSTQRNKKFFTVKKIIFGNIRMRV